MALRLHWFLPLHGDGREVARPAPGAGPAAPDSRRAPDLGYVAAVAQAAEAVGFTGALVPTGLFCEDPWLMSAALAAHTRRLQFMVALRPGSTHPMVCAQAATTLQRLSQGRLLFNVVTGGDPDELRRYGDWLDHDQRYQRADEFLDVFGGVWPGRPYDFTGTHYQVAAGLLARPYPVRPTVFLGGSSPAARRVAAARADVYLAWGEPPDDLAVLIKDVAELAERHGRRIAFGSRFHVIARRTADEAWQVTEDLLRGMDAQRVQQAQERFRRSESEGQRRMAALHGGRTDALTVYPNLWAGYGLVRPGAGVALVGSYQEVADRIEQYHALGLAHLILSGQPHLEEAYTVGEGVLPLLRERGLLAEGPTQ